MPLLTCQRAIELQKDLPTLLPWYTFLLMFNFHGFNVERLLPANEVCILGERFAPDALWCGRQSPCPAVTTGYAPRRGRPATMRCPTGGERRRHPSPRRGASAWIAHATVAKRRGHAGAKEKDDAVVREKEELFLKRWQNNSSSFFRPRERRNVHLSVWLGYARLHGSDGRGFLPRARMPAARNRPWWKFFGLLFAQAKL